MVIYPTTFLYNSKPREYILIRYQTESVHRTLQIVSRDCVE
jgi:hypothetical protein